jgi:3',5'-cyclic AMP phosphodiesterase CpdA
MSSSPAPNITVLFRYRDLIAHTIEEHEKIIREFGVCLWGWWKRPTEKRRDDIWEHLQARLVAEKEVPVALFDSGAENSEQRVHIAWITEIRAPTGEGRHVPTVDLADSEKKLVPGYYRESIFSRAWLKISKFECEKLPFFQGYSYDEPPPLPGVSKSDLERLRGKVVVDRDELRAMDTTIWRVRVSEGGDPKDRFLSSSVKLDHSVSASPVRVRGTRILHLSDLHFSMGAKRGEHRWSYPGDGSNRPTLADALVRTLENDNIKDDIGVLVVTGDFTYIASQEEFDAALAQLSALQGALDLGSDNIVLVPGNHDIRWTTDATYSPSALVTEAPRDAVQAYRTFYKKLLGHNPDEDLCMGRRFLFHNGVVVDVCALNSSALAQGKNFLAGMGQVPHGALDRIARDLGWTKPGASLRLLAMHHHLIPTEDVEDPAEFNRGFGMANDAQSTFRSAANLGVSLILHGHRHRPFVWRSAAYALPNHVKPDSKWELGEVNILGCGSTGSTSVPTGANYFNVLTPEHHRLRLSFYEAPQNSQFQRMSSWIAKLHLGDEGLRASPWVIER